MSSGGVTAEAAAERFATDVAALTERAAVVPDRHGLVWIRGDDAVSFLDALVSQSVASTEPGSVRRSFLLTPQGKMRAFLWILGGAEGEVGLITQRSTVETVVADLTRFRFRVDASIDVDARPIATVVGPGAEAALLAADIPRPGDGWLTTQSGLVARVPFTSGLLPRFVLVGDTVAASSTAMPAAGETAYESVRISMGEPAGGIDFNDSTISHELGPVDAAVDFTKGCYLGQELVARIDSRGRVNRSLRTLRAPGNLDLTGATLVDDDKSVGTITSAAPARDGNGTIGLALVRREVEDGMTVMAAVADEEVPVTVHELPLA